MPYLTINHRKMHYADTGEGDVILFGHSFLWDSDMWKDQVAVLSERYRCIVPDLWGHGQSDMLGASAVSISALAEDHLALMDALGIERFSIVGLSVGGMWAAHIAAKYPERIDKLVLCDTDLGKEPLRNKLKYYVMIKMMQRAQRVTPKLEDKVVPIFFSHHTLENNTALVAYFREKLLGIDAASIPTIAALAKAVFWREDFLHALPNIQANTAVIVGAEDIARPPHEARRMANLIPNASLHIIENAGHIPARERPEETNNILNTLCTLQTKSACNLALPSVIYCNLL